MAHPRNTMHGNHKVEILAKFEKEFRKNPLTKDLPGHAWDYMPHATYFRSKYCTYCGEPATTVDIIPDLLLLVAKSTLPRQKLIVAACMSCRHHLALDFDVEYAVKPRKAAIARWLGNLWRHHRGPLGGTARRILERRFQHALGIRGAHKGLGK